MEKIKLLLFVEFVAMLACALGDVMVYIIYGERYRFESYIIMAIIAFVCWGVAMFIIVPVAKLIFNL